MKIGLILPHFSDQSSWECLIGWADRIEALRFDSVWVRDNLNYRGHDYELPGRRFVDPFITLSAVASRTRELGLGTAVLVPYRHPLVTTQLIGSLAWVSRGRLQVGIGPGAPRDPFDLTGTPFEDRVSLCKETVDILRGASSGQPFSYSGRLTSFEDVVIDPPPPPSTMIWYGGASKASVRRAAEYCDGLLPGRCPFDHFDFAQRAIVEQGERVRRPLRIGSIPLLVVEDNAHRAQTTVNALLPKLLPYLSNQWRKDYRSLDDISGALVFGDPSMVAEQLFDFVTRKVDLVILDARLQMADFERVVSLVGEEILPLLSKDS